MKIIICLAIAVAGAALLSYAGGKCTALDVATGRREAMALADDYGSNRGFYWPWSPLQLVGVMMMVGGGAACFV